MKSTREKTPEADCRPDPPSFVLILHLYRRPVEPLAPDFVLFLNEEKNENKTCCFPFCCMSFLSFCGCDASVNSSRHLGDGERSHGLTSVNGSIYVGARCIVDGSCHTVNGRIEVGDGSQVETLETVNGRIRHRRRCRRGRERRNGQRRDRVRSGQQGARPRGHGQRPRRAARHGGGRRGQHRQRRRPAAGKERRARRHRHQGPAGPFFRRPRPRPGDPRRGRLASWKAASTSATRTARSRSTWTRIRRSRAKCATPRWFRNIKD